MSLRKNLIVLVASTAIIILLALSILQIHWANTIVIEQAVNRVKTKTFKYCMASIR